MKAQKISWGVRESADGAIIDPALASHAAKKQASRAEILKQIRQEIGGGAAVPPEQALTTSHLALLRVP